MPKAYYTKKESARISATWDTAGAGYHSLSQIARKITGTRWSRPAFFGLKNETIVRSPSDAVAGPHSGGVVYVITAVRYGTMDVTVSEGTWDAGNL